MVLIVVAVKPAELNRVRFAKSCVYPSFVHVREGSVGIFQRTPHIEDIAGLGDEGRRGFLIEEAAVFLGQAPLMGAQRAHHEFRVDLVTRIELLADVA